MAWRHNDLTALTGIPPVTSGSRSDGYETFFNQTQHINFIGNDNHVHELFYASYNGHWHHHDLTNLSGGPSAFASYIVGYETPFDHHQHVIFFGSDFRVHELYNDGAWHHNDLTSLTGAPAANPGSSLDGYVTTFNQQQHVNFMGRDNHVHELYYDGVWHHHDLTSLAGAPAAITDGIPIDGYQTTFNDQQHVNFIGNDSHIHELYYDGAWHHNDLTALAGAPAPGGDTMLVGYETRFNQQQHVVFLVDIPQGYAHVHELYYDTAWHHNDLTLLSGAPNASGAGISWLDAYVTTSNKQQHINFVDDKAHVHELYNDGEWHHNDLTLLAAAPNAVGGSSLDAYETIFNDQQHVNFQSIDGHIHELYSSTIIHRALSSRA